MKGNFLFGAALLLLTGCFSGGLPEYFASAKKSGLFPTQQRPRAVLVTVDNPQPMETLGHQFVFGIFPVTQLFISHGPQVFLEEQLADVLTDLNYDVLRAGGSDPDAILALPAALKIVSNISDVSLNAYDLIFWRRLSFQARVDFLCGGQQAQLRIDESDTKSTAHVDELAAYMRHVLRNRLLQAVHACEQNPSRVPPQSPTQVVKPQVKTVWLEFPRGEISNSVLDAFQASYGVQNRKQFTSADLRRIAQHGAEKALAESYYTLVLSASHGGRASDVSADHLLFTIESLELDPNLKLSVDFALLSQKLRCTIEQPLEKSRDGYLVWALEAAAQNITARALGADVPGVLCETRG